MYHSSCRLLCPYVYRERVETKAIAVGTYPVTKSQTKLDGWIGCNAGMAESDASTANF